MGRGAIDGDWDFVHMANTKLELMRLCNGRYLRNHDLE